MSTTIYELENELQRQESYFDNVIRLGLLYENTGDYQKAMTLYKKGLDFAEKAKRELSGTMLGLID
ncbi:MAG: hypothetical protein A2W91_09705 [Bacteroidetes bacterium GWF2_38_335]|nr:MAG: hypothetical protein A2W91_09705 [Bacteroidetes bacterium GWF2_38_335]OFY78865.1 MAG: hypothetical protein A2281_14040 [Bacteroidetes bacterium RIFOXYA12_FULL_38_20]HBS86291.1 hypothetical protein [Bacteroidales bacterium]